MAIQPDPTKLTTTTKLPPPTHKRNFSTSRSPARSPTRKAQFAARELDPLLRDLSPESTLEALLAADAISENRSEQNTIAKCIADASESERKLSIRAAVASKKLKEWTDEVLGWSWPSSTDRAWGAGFITPELQSDTKYLGSLPQAVVQKHEDRLDEIWDAIETLGLDEIKDSVFSSHHSISSSSATTGYGRLRDITALTTATVIQSLPVLAKLRIFLETWSIRLTVLRQIPDLLTSLQQVKLGLDTINAILKDPEQSRKLNARELEKGKLLFGNKVSNLGKRIDALLDMLDDQEDTLPQVWIDSLEDIERKYAHWAEDAARVVAQNERSYAQWVEDAARVAVQNETRRDTQHPPALDLPVHLPDADVNSTSPTSVALQLPHTEAGPEGPHLNMSDPQRTANTAIKRKPLLEINPKADIGHKRGVSEVSMANSTFSNYSENAEILDAHATPMLPSPRISVIDHQLPSGSSKTSWMAPRATEQLSPTRPPFVQRASTASIEVVPKEQIRKVLLRKSASHDMLSSLHSTGDADSVVPSLNATPRYELGDPLVVPALLTPLAVSPSPSLMVDPLSFQGGKLKPIDPPIVPRKSSKRRSMPLLEQFIRSSTPPHNAALTSHPPKGPQHERPITPPKQMMKAETFDDKLKTILATMPAPFQLSDGSGSDSSELSSVTSSRSSSPQRVLKLSPVKSHNTNSGFDERVYHLRNNRSKDTKPIRLLIRAVGTNGDRIMVRVGGGWADLAEYLREYSLHHGSKRLADGKLEVANYSSAQAQRSSMLAAVPTKSATVPDQDFDFGLSEAEERKSKEEQELETNPWRPPPVPVVTENYAGPIARSTSPSRERVQMSPPPPASYRPASRTSTTITTPTVTTTVASSNHYTPLGGAGPVLNKRRSAAQNSLRSTADEAWVEGMVSKARTVSGGQIPHHHSHHSHASPSTPTSTTTISSSPFMTTTTTISSSKPRATAAPSSRRVSSWSMMSTPVSTNNANQRFSTISTGQESQLSQISSASSERSSSSKKKSRMSLGDVGGIRRVFLRKKSDK